MTRLVWGILGGLSFGLALVGVLVPLLPTVPFLLLAAFFFARSSERLHHWLLTHPKFGASIQDWNDRGAISKRAKIAATVSILASIALTFAIGVDAKVLFIQAAVLVTVSLFIWTRPSV